MPYVILIILGVAFGSFINALVWRLHYNRKKGRKKHLSIVRGRSMCSHCHHQLAAADLVPVFSWLVLRGKCRYCHRPITDTPVAELATPVVFVLSYVFWPFALDTAGWVLFAVWLAATVVAVALIIYDIRWMTLPDSLNQTLLVFSVLFVGARVVIDGWQVLPMAIISGLLFFGFFYALHIVSDGQWIGGGDVKLAPSLGLLIGEPLGVFFALFLSSLLGLLASLPQIVSGSLKLQAKIPFGPFLLVATIIVVLFQSGITSWLLTPVIF